VRSLAEYADLRFVDLQRFESPAGPFEVQRKNKTKWETIAQGEGLQPMTHVWLAALLKP
jgi:hypothetical protein